MFWSFPFEAEPDGAVFGPHHFYLGVLLTLLVCWVVADADDGKPWAVAGLTLLAVFSFSLTWPYYPAVGAAGTLILLGGATLLAGLRPYWWRRGFPARAALVVGLLVALDDAVSHALGWQTPLDAMWAEYLHPYVSDPWLPSGLASHLPSGFPRSVPSGLLPGAPSGLLPGVLPDVPSGLVPTVRLPVSLPDDLASQFGVWLSPELEAFLLEQFSDVLAVVAL